MRKSSAQDLLKRMNEQGEKIQGIGLFRTEVQPGCRDFRSFCIGSRQGCFTLGGLTHNED
jgi:hypothetical protein